MPILHWLTRETDLKLSGNAPYRLLETMDELSYGDLSTGNMLIQGDNLDALKALLPYYAGAVKCIYIDPPYNTRSAFEHYDDNLEHTKWLSMIYPRLELLRELMAEDGSIWVSIDDHEAHYLKVVMDEIFGRGCFIASPVWQKRYSRENREAIGDVHEYILIYTRNRDLFKASRNRLPVDVQQAKIYKNPENPRETDPTKRWRGLPMTAQGYRPNQMYTITAPNGRLHTPPEGRCWSMIESEFQKLLRSGRIYWGKNGNAQPSVIRYLSEVDGMVPWTWWPHEEVGHTDESKKECNVIFGADVSFGTPKPERLIQRVLHIASNPGDLILDSFLGSGTTAAVAQKMGRRFIGIEMGEHAVTHCAPRLRKVVDGEQGGISEAMNWHGGGGFRFFRLGDPIFEEDGSIRAGITFAQLAAHVWFSETKTPLTGKPESPLLGVHDGTAYYLLFNGILKDKSVGGGNVLTSKILEGLPPHDGPRVIYGERCLFGGDRLRDERITFKHTPYDIKGR
ncbi:site-specific DNA-methyltransferase [Nitratidesulfovibrio sp. HK-II]|uniref:site-specific DNA-methyltransferase n=1 Tax=Nitratidesulfovibrio sp. HK-II TaxID=2009266 RepID=UPI000E2EDE02|nr:site-specific DNA-methyltransferase [Nitratidesulfovibrio sp. HK-II]GBO97047.1 type III restriction-modification system methylation subunit [Nitratidesulfovibrio sp. HK-II]